MLAGWLAFSAKPTPALPSAEIASVSNHSASLGGTNAASGILSGKAIEEIRVGDRVAAYNPEVTDSERAGWIEPDAATWEVIDLEMPKRDGGLLEISLLRPKTWLADQQATVGSEVYLDSRELNAIGNAKVIAIRPCPTIESGSGRVVVGTFKHNSSDIVDIFVSSQTSPIGTTSDHPFWSRDRQAFVPAAKLLPGEKLLSIDGATLQVTAVTPRATPSAVYNLEIQGEHAYAVSDAGVVVHNSEPYDGLNRVAEASDKVHPALGDPDRILTAADLTVPRLPRRYGPEAGEVAPHNWGKHITKQTGVKAPEDMVRPHGHHINMKEGQGSQIEFVENGKDLLEFYDIPWFRGTGRSGNLVHAPNVEGQHTTENACKLYNELLEVHRLNVEAGLTWRQGREMIAERLQDAGRRMARLEF